MCVRDIGFCQRNLAHEWSNVYPEYMVKDYPAWQRIFPPSKEKKKKPLHGSARCRPKVWKNKLTQSWFKTRYNQFEF